MANPTRTNFLGLVSITYLERIYKALDGIESYFAAHLAKLVGIIHEHSTTERLPLPEELKRVPVLGPEWQVLILSLSKDKGIRFHLHVEHTTPLYRDRFLRLLAEHAELWHRDHIEYNLPFDDKAEERGFTWWQALQKHAYNMESEGGKIDIIAPVTVGERKLP